MNYIVCVLGAIAIVQTTIACAVPSKSHSSDSDEKRIKYYNNEERYFSTPDYNSYDYDGYYDYSCSESKPKYRKIIIEDDSLSRDKYHHENYGDCDYCKYAYYETSCDSNKSCCDKSKTFKKMSDLEDDLKFVPIKKHSEVRDKLDKYLGTEKTSDKTGCCKFKSNKPNKTVIIINDKDDYRNSFPEYSSFSNKRPNEKILIAEEYVPSSMPSYPQQYYGCPAYKSPFYEMGSCNSMSTFRY